MNAKDLEVSISENAITIQGERCNEKQPDDVYIRKECHGGTFSRTIAMPEEAELEKASASLAQNVLTVEVPKKSEAKNAGRTLKIEAEAPAPKAEATKIVKEEEGARKPELVSKNDSGKASTQSSQSEPTSVSKDKKSKVA